MKKLRAELIQRISVTIRPRIVRLPFSYFTLNICNMQSFNFAGCCMWVDETRCPLYRKRIFESRVQRKLLGPKIEGVTGDHWKLNNEEFHDLYSPSNIILEIKSRRMRGAGHVLCTGEMRGAYRVLVGKPEGEKPRRRPRGSWEDNIIMDLRNSLGGCRLDYSS